MTDDDRSIERLIKQAGGAFEPSGDLPERITRRVKQRQQHRRIAVSVCAALVAVMVIGGGLVLAGDDGPDSELETATGGPERSTTTTTSAPSTTPPTGPPTTPPSTPSTTLPPDFEPEEGSATEIFVLRGDPTQLVEVSLETGEVRRHVIPLEGMTDVEARGDEEWWVRREPVGDCAGFRWEEYHAVGAGGFPFPDATEAAISPDGGFLAYVRTPPGACEGGSELVVRDLGSEAEAVTPGLVNVHHLTWRMDSDAVAYAVEDSPFEIGDERIDSVAVSTDIVAGGELSPLTKIPAVAGCSMRSPAFLSGEQAMYVSTCGTGDSAITTIVTEGIGAFPPTEIEVPVDDPDSISGLAVHPVTRQVAYVADGAAWIVEGTNARKVIDGARKVRWPMTVPG